MFLPIRQSLKQELLEGNSSSHEYEILKTNGYLKPFNECFEGIITGEDIELSVCNIPQVIFEVTSACNLRCEYCCYGNGYETFKNRTSGELSLETVKIVLDSLLAQMNSLNNTSTQTPFVISFYGGEPLLNIKIVKEIVEYSKGLHFPHRILNYSMTTNATHLAKNIDFLRDNNFHLLVSLDGDRHANQHRKMADGRDSFDAVIENLLIVKNKYPDYFKSIRYNAVFSNTSDIDEVLLFFRKTFDTVPTISVLHEPDKSAIGYESIKNMIKPIDLPRTETTIDEAIFQIPLHKRIADFLFKLTHNYYTSEIDILLEDYNAHYATATCIPFAKRMFVSTNGNIFPCEKICRDIPFGRIIDGKMRIDYAELSNRHNYQTQEEKKQCALCYLQSCCNQCLHNFKNGRCRSFKSQKQFEEILSEIFSYMELHPEIVNVLENNIVLR